MNYLPTVCGVSTNLVELTLSDGKIITSYVFCFSLSRFYSAHTPILSAQPFGMLARARTSDFVGYFCVVGFPFGRRAKLSSVMLPATLTHTRRLSTFDYVSTQKYLSNLNKIVRSYYFTITKLREGASIPYHSKFWKTAQKNLISIISIFLYRVQRTQKY